MAFVEREGRSGRPDASTSSELQRLAEGFVRSIKEQCLDGLIVLRERHLRRAVAEFVAHYHAERNHQGLDNELIQPLRLQEVSGAIRRRQRMGGMLNYYYRAA